MPGRGEMIEEGIEEEEPEEGRGKRGEVGAEECMGEEGGVGRTERAWATSGWGTLVENIQARQERVADFTGVSISTINLTI